MKILVDVDELRQQGLISAETASMLQTHALRDTGSTAINILLAFGAVAVAAGVVALTFSAGLTAVFGFLFIVLGWLARTQARELWGKLGSIWMVVGALVLSGAVGYISDHPLIASVVAAAIFAVVAALAQSRLLAALVPLALASSIGGSTGYWTGCYEIVVREPTLTIVLFAALAFVGWQFVKRTTGWLESLGLAFTRMSVILVNFGFWVGSLWGDNPGLLWKTGADSGYSSVLFDHPQISPLIFVVAWLVALVAAGTWAAKEGRRFLVNTVAVFGSIHLYSQWFERFGANPGTVIVAGLATIAIGLLLWQYNRKLISPA